MLFFHPLHKLGLCRTWGGRTARLYELMLLCLHCDRGEDGGGLLTHEMQAHIERKEKCSIGKGR